MYFDFVALAIISDFQCTVFIHMFMMHFDIVFLDEYKWINECCKSGEIQLCNDAEAMYSGSMHYICYLYVGTRTLTYLLIYLLTQLARAYKAGNISETAEDWAKGTINGLYKVVHWLPIAAKMYDLEWPLSEIQGRRFFTCSKNGEIQLSSDSLTPCRVLCLLLIYLLHR